jgi:hypothetical protein
MCGKWHVFIGTGWHYGRKESSIHSIALNSGHPEQAWVLLNRNLFGTRDGRVTGSTVKGGGEGKRGEMTQTLYAHMNKRNF